MTSQVDMITLLNKCKMYLIKQTKPFNCDLCQINKTVQRTGPWLVILYNNIILLIIFAWNKEF